MGIFLGKGYPHLGKIPEKHTRFSRSSVPRPNGNLPPQAFDLMGRLVSVYQLIQVITDLTIGDQHASARGIAQNELKWSKLP